MTSSAGVCRSARLDRPATTTIAGIGAVIFTAARLGGAFLIDVERHEDERGFLARTFCEREFAEQGAPMRIVQSSTIRSPRRHTLRGLHYQEPPHAEIKLVRCTQGSIFLVMVDLRPVSPTRNEWLGAELSSRNRRLAYVPGGFAQGYQTLEDDTEVLYQMSQYYVPDAACGVRWDDPTLRIDWPAANERLISERDRAWPDLSSTSAASSRSAERRTTA
jgi:dTDP-4-dehydrorhamnose 3,5-epimerase